MAKHQYYTYKNVNQRINSIPSSEESIMGLSPMCLHHPLNIVVFGPIISASSTGPPVDPDSVQVNAGDGSSAFV